MIALWIIGSVLAYAGVGVKCAKADIDDSINHGLGKKDVTTNAVVTFWAWPWWMAVELPRILFEKRVDKRLTARQLQLESDREVEKLLASGDLDD
jgi:hypothetical protein